MNTLTKEQLKRFPKFVEKVEKYVEKENEELIESKKSSYIFFADEPKKIYIKSVFEMVHAMEKNPKKYEGRTFVFVSRGINSKEKREGFSKDIVMFVNFAIHIVEEGGYVGKIRTGYSAIIYWKLKDFTVSKLTKKLFKKLTELALEKKLKTGAVFGSSLETVIGRLKEKGIDISDCLSPINI